MIASLLAVVVSIGFGFYNIIYNQERQDEQELKDTLETLIASVDDLIEVDDKESDYRGSLNYNTKREIVLSTLKIKLDNNEQYIDLIGPNTLALLADHLLTIGEFEEAHKFYHWPLSKSRDSFDRSVIYGKIGHFHGLDTEFKNDSLKYSYWHRSLTVLDSIRPRDYIDEYTAELYKVNAISEYESGQLDSANSFMLKALDLYANSNHKDLVGRFKSLERTFFEENIKAGNLKIGLNDISLREYLNYCFKSTRIRKYFATDFESENTYVNEFVKTLWAFVIVCTN